MYLARLVAEAQHGHAARLGAERELADELLHLEQVARDPGRVAVPVRHVFGIEGWVAWSRAVDRLARLHDQLAHRARRGAADQHVHRADHVRLVDRSLVMGRVDHDREMHNRVDVELPHELADHGQARIGVHEVHLLKRADRIGDVTAEEKRHLRRQAARHRGAEGVGHARDHDSLGRHQPPNLIARVNLVRFAPGAPLPA
jgi:hypothetical protein